MPCKALPTPLVFSLTFVRIIHLWSKTRQEPAERRRWHPPPSWPVRLPWFVWRTLRKSLRTGTATCTPSALRVCCSLQTLAAISTGWTSLCPAKTSAIGSMHAKLGPVFGSRVQAINSRLEGST